MLARLRRWRDFLMLPMASGDYLLDANGNVMLDDAGNVMLDDGAGNACCCGGNSSGSCRGASWGPCRGAVSVTLSGFPNCLSAPSSPNNFQINWSDFNGTWTLTDNNGPGSVAYGGAKTFGSAVLQVSIDCLGSTCAFPDTGPATWYSDVLASFIGFQDNLILGPAWIFEGYPLSAFRCPPRGTFNACPNSGACNDGTLFTPTTTVS